MPENKFADGLYYKQPSAGAPSFVIGKISIKKEKFMPWIDQQQGEWINIDIKTSKEGKVYFQIDEWKPNN